MTHYGNYAFRGNVYTQFKGAQKWI
jgi:hypothetical protein